jgi:hypothetical protein
VLSSGSTISDAAQPARSAPSSPRIPSSVARRGALDEGLEPVHLGDHVGAGRLGAHVGVDLVGPRRAGPGSVATTSASERSACRSSHPTMKPIRDRSDHASRLWRSSPTPTISRWARRHARLVAGSERGPPRHRQPGRRAATTPRPTSTSCRPDRRGGASGGALGLAGVDTSATRRDPREHPSCGPGSSPSIRRPAEALIAPDPTAIFGDSYANYRDHRRWLGRAGLAGAGGGPPYVPRPTGPPGVDGPAVRHARGRRGSTSPGPPAEGRCGPATVRLGGDPDLVAVLAARAAEAGQPLASPTPKPSAASTSDTSRRAGWLPLAHGARRGRRRWRRRRRR